MDDNFPVAALTEPSPLLTLYLLGTLTTVYSWPGHGAGGGRLVSEDLMTLPAFYKSLNRLDLEGSL